MGRGLRRKPKRMRDVYSRGKMEISHLHTGAYQNMLLKMKRLGGTLPLRASDLYWLILYCQHLFQQSEEILLLGRERSSIRYLCRYEDIEQKSETEICFQKTLSQRANRHKTPTRLCSAWDCQDKGHELLGQKDQWDTLTWLSNPVGWNKPGSTGAEDL